MIKNRESASLSRKRRKQVIFLFLFQLIFCMIKYYDS
jgi:hypothetical protein